MLSPLAYRLKNQHSSKMKTTRPVARILLKSVWPAVCRPVSDQLRRLFAFGSLYSALTALLLAPLAVLPAADAPKQSRSAGKTAGGTPNILVLYADDLGYGDLGCYNPASKIPTPNLDRLAEQGMRFTDAHSSSGICTPSRYALLTGRHHWRDFHGIVNAFGSSVFKPERLTLPEMLQAKGYATAAIGKWHLGWDWDAIKKPGAKPQGEGKNQVWGPEAFDWSKPIPNGPLAHGFDHYFGDTVINFPPYCWIEDDKVLQAPDVLMDTQLWKPPLLRSETASVRTSHVHNTSENRYAIRDGDWLLVDSKDGYVSRRNAAWEARHGYPPGDDLPVELYNLKTDLPQKHNLAAEQPEKVAQLKALLQQIREQGHSAPRLQPSAK